MLARPLRNPAAVARVSGWACDSHRSVCNPI
jgi:hypothetical protein